MIRRTLLTLALASALLPVTAFATKPTNAQKCEAAAETVSGKYVQCRLSAESAFAKTGNAAKLSAALGKCVTKLDTAFGKATSKYGVACPMTEPVAAFNTYLTQCSADTTAAAGGAPFPNAAPSAQLLKTGQMTSYGAGSDGDLQKGVAQNYVDNGDGTITDTKTGLMWEKKSDDGSIHDKDTTYTWGQDTSPYSMNGTMVTTFLAALNTGSGFAGHTDWRLPNRRELESIVNLENTSPAVSAAFNTNCGADSSGNAGCMVTACSCTVPDYYWSSSTDALSPQNAWIVYFGDGNIATPDKTHSYYVRAVRGGS
jgi:hypothetical protein